MLPDASAVASAVSFISAASTRCSSIAACAALIGISTNFRVRESPPCRSTQFETTSVESESSAGVAIVFPLRSLPPLAVESCATTSSENGVLL